MTDFSKAFSFLYSSSITIAFFLRKKVNR